LSLLGLVVGIGVAVGGIAYAAIPDANGVINSCYSKSTGGLRVAERATDCRSGETALSWNQQGRVGPTGPQGPAGPANPTFVSEQEATFANEEDRTVSFDGPGVPAGEYTLQISVAPFTTFGDTAADVSCAVQPLSSGTSLADYAHLDRAAGVSGATFSWIQHGLSGGTGPLGRVNCSVVSGDGTGFLGFHSVIVATKIK
jgi:hypothetical protein